jgi:Ca2+-dependent lipid-binding protein
MQVEREKQRPKAQQDQDQCIGTVSVSVLDCKDMALDPSMSRADVFCVARIDRQTQKTRATSVHLVPNVAYSVRWNQSFVFSIRSLDDLIRFEVFVFDKYSQDELVGKTEMALHILEYYNGQETEVMTLKLAPNSGKLRIRMHYKIA